MSRHSKITSKTIDKTKSLSNVPPPISEEHYFEKAAEFQTWLSERGHCFHDLSKTEASNQFQKFVKRWNKGKLDARFYKGIQTSEVLAAARTTFKWKIKNVDETETELVRDSVESMTSSKTGFNFPLRKEQSMGPPKGPLTNMYSRGQSTSSGYTTGTNSGDRRNDHVSRSSHPDTGPQLKKRGDREHYRNQETLLDEIAPKETGREAMLQKRYTRNAYHKQERDLDPEIPDDVLMGGGSDFRAAVASQSKTGDRREQKRETLRQEKSALLAGKVEAHRAKEDATIAMFREMAKNNMLQ
ncbi:hypothetical protein BASA61_007418 [Batrachochytrium salamandrivorans]|nr:hypothetical protein BASA61_007418 [Batrachochytrium salamandrivorans]KAH9265369.1 hypothetical protein BASA84_001638 [Batrachochytrium salamandrivorans]KAJ1330624.1 hypothetical protein BSLG_009076 [Batrachochytrium salamandrivorans]